MKRILLALALVASVQVANAQIKSDADIQKAVEKAEAAALDAKKGAKPAPWVKLGEAYVKAYSNPTANISTGIDKQTFALMAGEKPSAVETITTADGQTYEKQVLSHANVYFTQAGNLAFYEVTKPSVAGDPLEKAVEAYAKAFQLGAKDKDVDAALQNIVGFYYQDAITAYSLGNLPKASDLFGKAAAASMTPPSSKIDTNAVYNTAFTAANAGNFARAKEYYNKCLDLGYAAEGSVYAALSNCALADKDTTAAKQYLADGLKLYPDNASVLTNLINLYIQMKEDPKKIVELLDEAKAQMPDNPSLYYVEGNILTGIKDWDGALAAYKKASEIDPNYEWGYYGEGSLWLQKQAALVDEANALPVNAYKEYDAKMEEISQALKKAAPAFEACYAKATNEDLKGAAADFLKRVYFALRNEGEEYKAAYEKYNAIVGGE
ncbi:MAG: tetratricopeptide repeat protein [Bacteroidales bacterium]|nr:tetratricopeptide repeat protein [Bacteroidales bacterium]